MTNQLYQRIPQLNKLLESDEGRALCEEFDRNYVVEALRSKLYELRVDIKNNALNEASFETKNILKEARHYLSNIHKPKLKQLINATGVIIHTNLGRAALAKQTITAIEDIALSYSNLEFDLATGERGSRYTHVDELLTLLTKAEAALVVNNCAAAVLLVLSTFAKDKEVIVSRGELIEIGGSFRMPDVILQSGAKLVEVGSTNKTKISDYELAITDETSLILKSHTSNYEVIGFTSKPTIEELAALATMRNIPFVEDLGSGALVDLDNFGLPNEPKIQDCIQKGVDIVTFSGDKLLGGPQAGIILGKKNYISAMKKNPLLRALRIDKLCLSALEVTLKQYIPPNNPFETIPVMKMLNEDTTSIANRANKVANGLSNLEEISINVREGTSLIGGGSLPSSVLPTSVVCIKSKKYTQNELAKHLRNQEPAVIGRISDDYLVLDMRTVQECEVDNLIAAIKTAA